MRKALILNVNIFETLHKNFKLFENQNSLSKIKLPYFNNQFMLLSLYTVGRFAQFANNFVLMCVPISLFHEYCTVFAVCCNARKGIENLRNQNCYGKSMLCTVHTDSH